MKTHKERILMHLQYIGYITSQTAIHSYGNTRLSATIFALRDEGHNIRTEMVEVKNRYGIKTRVAKYFLIE